MILRCAFDFPDGIRVPYVIQWQKNGVKIPIYIWYDGYPPHIGEGYEGRVGLSGQASLNLSTVNENDQGWYECKVFFLNRPPEPIKNGTWVHLDVHGMSTSFCFEFNRIRHQQWGIPNPPPPLIFYDAGAEYIISVYDPLSDPSYMPRL